MICRCGSIFTARDNDMETSRLLIRNFGPVREAEIVFDRFTFFIGEQGSGKSTVLKLYSLFRWLEKALARHQITEKYLSGYSRFRKTYCAFNGLTSYFQDDSEIAFEGPVYRFHYVSGKLSVQSVEQDDDMLLSLAKVMYVPAERVILGTVDHPSRLHGLSESLRTFDEEFENAKSRLSEYVLPFGDAKFKYDRLNDIPSIQTSQYEVRLSEASSGYQSSTSLLIVSRYLSRMVKQRSDHSSDLDPAAFKALQHDVEKIMNDASLSEDVRSASLRSISSRYSYSSFINIVEEMELNLFPTTQRMVLFELIADVHAIENNQLILSTHSPYVITDTGLAVKAWQVYQKTSDVGIRKKICRIVPEESMIDPAHLHIYEMKDGGIHLLENYQGIPSDSNYLNNLLAQENEDFDTLMDLEDQTEFRLKTGTEIKITL